MYQYVIHLIIIIFIFFSFFFLLFLFFFPFLFFIFVFFFTFFFSYLFSLFLFLSFTFHIIFLPFPGPRSISQVRRENKKHQNNDLNEGEEDGKDVYEDIDINSGEANYTGNNNSSNDVNNGSSGNSINISNNNNATNDNINNNGNNNITTKIQKTISNYTSPTTENIPKNIYDICNTNTKNNNCSIVIIWVSKINGILIRGMHCCNDISLLPEYENKINNTSNIYNNTENNNKNTNNTAMTPQLINGNKINKKIPSKFLTFNIKHEKKMEIKFSSFLPKIYVPVTVFIQSNSSRKIDISVEIIDNKKMMDLNYNNTDTTNNTNNNNNTNKLTPNLSQYGLKWDNKTSYIDIELLPYELKVLDFSAVISQYGIYDLNR